MDSVSVDPVDEDRVLGLLAAFDPAWLPSGAGLIVDEATRSGVRRISPRADPVERLDQLVDLYREQRARLLGTARRLMNGHQQDGEDVLAEVLKKICTNPRVLDRVDDLSAYLFRAIRNEAATRGGRLATERARTDDDAEAAEAAGSAGPSPTFDEAVVRNMIVARALATLSEKQRQAVDLVYLQRYTTKEAGERTGLAEGTIKRTLSDARKRLCTDPGIAGFRGEVA